VSQSWREHSHCVASPRGQGILPAVAVEVPSVPMEHSIMLHELYEFLLDMKGCIL
jgi:hypothetical protein